MTRLLATTIIVLFFGLSANAYACLIPLYGTPDMAMEAGCPSGDEPSPREFCDVFKAGVPADPSLLPVHAAQMVLSIIDVVALARSHDMAEGNRDPGYSTDKLSQHIFLKTTILRI